MKPKKPNRKKEIAQLKLDILKMEQQMKTYQHNTPERENTRKIIQQKKVQLGVKELFI